MKRLTLNKVFDIIHEMNIEYIPNLMSVKDAQTLAKRLESEYEVTTNLIIRNDKNWDCADYSSLYILGRNKKIAEIRVEKQ